MKAATCSQYGPPEVLRVEDVEKPIPKKNEVLVKIHASSVTMGDCELRGLFLPKWIRFPIRLMMGYRKPRKYTPGLEFSGVVESVGSEVKNFQAGDEVFGSSGLKMGGNAEYKCHSSTYGITKKPTTISHEEAVTIIVGGLNAFHFLSKANIQPGQKVLINGAGGNIGTYGVQLAKLYGAEVTAIDSADKLDMLKNIGADHVIDYTKEDFRKSKQKYDVLLDVIYSSSYSKCISSLKSDGCYLMANTHPINMIRGAWLTKTSSKRIVSEMAGEKTEDMDHIAALIAEGKIKPVIDKKFTLNQIVEAHQYVENGFKKGCVVITN